MRHFVSKRKKKHLKWDNFISNWNHFNLKLDDFVSIFKSEGCNLQAKSWNRFRMKWFRLRPRWLMFEATLNRYKIKWNCSWSIRCTCNTLAKSFHDCQKGKKVVMQNYMNKIQQSESIAARYQNHTDFISPGPCSSNLIKSYELTSWWADEFPANRYMQTLHVTGNASLVFTKYCISCLSRVRHAVRVIQEIN